jgi:hypothetical protein
MLIPREDHFFTPPVSLSSYWGKYDTHPIEITTEPKCIYVQIIGILLYVIYLVSGLGSISNHP